jgi:Ca-activated chloride channel family protein
MARTSFIRWAIAAAAAASVALCCEPRVAAQGAVFKGGIDMVPLTVTVTTPAGHCVPGLTADDFVVFEDGVRQSVAFFASEPVPVDVAFVLDTSSSMARDLPLVQEAASGMVRKLGDADRGAVIDVKGTVGIARPLTTDHAEIEAAIDALKASGTTALYDGLYVVLREFERDRSRQDEIRRQALVVLTDGVDNKSHVPADQVVDLARGLGVSIYIVALKDAAAAVPTSLPRTREALQAEYVIKSLARDTGGRIFFPSSARELAAIYDAVAQELASQYQLGYVPLRPGEDGAFRRVSVRVVPSGRGVARTRSGYTASRRPVAFTPRSTSEAP